MLDLEYETRRDRPTEDRIEAALEHSTAAEALATAMRAASVRLWLPTPDQVQDLVTR